MWQNKQTVLLNLLKPKLHVHTLIKFNSTQCEELKIPVPWGHVAGKWWGRRDQRPILTLHGWQDNCGSFNRLIPLLKNDVAFLAIDFPGHGLSSRMPNGMYCYFSDYLILIQYLVNYFKWDKVSLIGHSLGGGTSFKYASIYPKNVDMLICIDGTKPFTENNNIEHMAQRLTNFFRYIEFEKNGGEPPSYTLDEIKRKICNSMFKSIAYEHSHHIIHRNVAPSKKYPGKFYFTRDPRLKVGDLVNWPHEDSVNWAAYISCPVFVAMAKRGTFYDKSQFEVIDVLRKSEKCEFHLLEGSHHVHLNKPEVLAALINKFLEKNNI